MASQLKRINRCLILGWIFIVLVLLVSYIVELFKGDRDVTYVMVFLAITMIPAFIVSLIYTKDPEHPYIRYFFTAGFFLMYAFVLLTGSTIMVFVYVVPMVSLIILYHDPRLVF